MRHSKPLFLILFLAFFSFLFNLGVPTSKAEVAAEMQELTAQLKEEVLLLQEQILILQERIGQIQLQLSAFSGEETAVEEEVVADCHALPLWDWHYCATDCKCKAGQGDCDSNTHCTTGYCALDVGVKYGQDRWIDVCEEKVATTAKVTTPKVTTPTIAPTTSPATTSEKTEEKVVATTCSDTDWFGNNNKDFQKRLTVKGTCTDAKGAYQDTCLNNTALREYYCAASWQNTQSCIYMDYYCDALGFNSCKNGACVKEGNLSVSLAEDSPATKTVFVGARSVEFLKAKFTVNHEENIKIDSLKVCVFRKEDGKSSSAWSSDVSNLKLYFGNSQISSTQAALVNGCAAFTGLNWVLQKSTSDALTVKADIPIGTSAPQLYMQINGGADIEAIGIASGAAVYAAGLALGNPVVISSTGYLSVALSSDNPESSTVKAGTNDFSALKFTLTNLTEKTISVEKISVKLEGKAQPNDFGNIYWRLSDGTLLGAAYFSQTASVDGFTSVSNPPAYEAGKAVIPPLFEIPSLATKKVIVSVDIKPEAGDGKTFQLTMPQELYLTLSDGYSVVGFPIEGNIMAIGGVTASCFDSDKGINEYAYGAITKDGVTNYDACFLGDNLKEWVCTAAGEKTYKLVECEYGCVDGVCKQAVGNDESTGVVCNDSDGGKDYETYGKVTHGDGAVTDYDQCESEITLKENYCQNGYYASETYECPQGCLNGACVAKTGLKNVENSLASVSEAISRLIENFKKLIGQ